MDVNRRRLPGPVIPKRANREAVGQGTPFAPLRGKTSERDPRRVDTILRHPLLILLVSFTLTGILGGLFTQWISGRQKEIEKSRSEIAIRKQAVQDFSRYVYRRRARAEMLASSFKRGATLDEIKQRKRDYDEAFADWNTNHQSNLLLIREVLRESDYSHFEQIVEFNLVSGILAPLDACLTAAYDAAVAGTDARAIVVECDSRRLLQSALDCGYAITDELFKLSGDPSTRAAATAEISEKCL